MTPAAAAKPRKLFGNALITNTGFVIDDAFGQRAKMTPLERGLNQPGSLGEAFATRTATEIRFRPRLP